jgi:peptide/nickel transport system substrate-binding protein
VLLKFGETPLTELLAGGVDIARVERAQLLRLRSDPRFRVYDEFLLDWRYGIYWNHRDPLFSDPVVRRALTLAIDRRELRQVLNLPADIPVVDVIFTGRQWRRGEVPVGLPYDSARAAAMLDGVGWRDTDGDGIRERNGAEFRFTALAPEAGQLDKAALYVQENLRQMGIRMEIQPADPSSQLVRERLRSGRYQALFARLNLGDGVDREGIFGDDSWLGYQNAEVTRLVGEIPSAVAPETQDSIHRALWPFFEEDLPAVFLYPLVGTFVADRRVRGLESPFRADPVMHAEELWLDDGQ